MKRELLFILFCVAIILIPNSPPTPSSVHAQIPFSADTPCYVKGGTGTTNDTTNHANCKAGPGLFKGARAINTTATIAYLRMYNLATDVTCSSSVGFVEAIPIPGNTTGAGFIDVSSNFPYSTGIAFCLTANGTNNDNNPPVAGVYVTIKYN